MTGKRSKRVAKSGKKRVRMRAQAHATPMQPKETVAERNIRLRKQGFQPGVSGNPAGKKPGVRNASVRIWDAIQSAEKDGWDLFAHLIERMESADPVLQTIMAKLLPTKVEGTVSPDDVNCVIQQVVEIVSKYVTDEKTVANIVSECESIDIPVVGKQT